MPNFGQETLMAFRNIEKILWFSSAVSSEFISRGFTTEARQFANELVATAEIWGLQIPFLIGKSNQVRALHFEGQKKKWQAELEVLTDALKTDGSAPFFRQMNPAAIAEAVSLEPIRRNSSTVSQSEAKEVQLNYFKNFYINNLQQPRASTRQWSQV